MCRLFLYFLLQKELKSFLKDINLINNYTLDKFSGLFYCQNKEGKIKFEFRNYYAPSQFYSRLFNK